MAPISTAVTTTFVYGTIIHSLSPTLLSIKKNSLLSFNSNGTITSIKEQVDESTLTAVLQSYPTKTTTLHRLSERQFLIPGFIDTHTHAPQFTFTGTGQDLPLLDWLNKYTFPHESSFASLDHARRMYAPVVSRLIRNGTTTACYYGTIHLDGTTALVDAILERGQRAFVGKVCMDRNAPDFYVENTNDSLRDTEEFIRRVRDRDATVAASEGRQGLVRAVVTPRFVPTCTMPLLKGLASIAKEHSLPIQSHVAENLSECRWVEELHPDCKSYADVYDQAGLLTPTTVMAHALYLSAEDRRVFKTRGVGISHCPNSNFTLRSGVLNVRRLLEEGLKVGLGTDVSGGYHPSMLDAVRAAATASKVVNMSETRPPSEKNVQPPSPSPSDHHPQTNSHSNSTEASTETSTETSYPPLTLAELVYLSTLGGAEVLGLKGVVGNFLTGAEFDALLVDLASADGPIDTYLDDDTPEERLEKFLFLGDDRCIRKVWVRGKCIRDV